MAFSFARTPDIRFGSKTSCELPEVVARYGTRILLITGGESLSKSGRLWYFNQTLTDHGMNVSIFSVAGEPSPNIVDEAVSKYYSEGIQVVVAIGGGSVLDAGKAISAMLPTGESVVDYLEGIGTKSHNGIKIPFVAIPTTSGTGSECTKNAVISRVGPGGFKKSLRHDNFVPDVALVDPELMLGCPKHITAACAMDAFSQLFESFVSTQAHAMTDALAYSGLQQMVKNMLPAYDHGSTDLQARIGIAYGAMQSGITLANVGLCVTHGFASSIGGMYTIPHGVICARILPAAVEITIRQLKRSKLESPEAEEMLYKHAIVAQLITGNNSADIDLVNEQMVQKIYDWVNYMQIPALGEFGITEANFENIASVTSCKNNPVHLNNSHLCEILAKSL